jgi:hypothetical protein
MLRMTRAASFMMGLGLLATDDPGCAARPGALVLDPFGDNQQIESGYLELT